MDKNLAILGFAGSLRSGSYNKALIRAAGELLPADSTLEAFDLEGVPLFNADLENNPPEKVKEFKAKIKASDALLISTPEYNYSVSGVLKNALDWASRPSTDNSLKGKPVAIMGASNGMLGTARAQYHLRQILTGLGAHTLNPPEVFVTFAPKKIDENGVLKDEQTREVIRKHLANLATWIRKLNPE